MTFVKITLSQLCIFFKNIINFKLMLYYIKIFVKTLSSMTENIYFYIKNEFKIIYSKYNRTLLKYE